MNDASTLRAWCAMAASLVALACGGAACTDEADAAPSTGGTSASGGGGHADHMTSGGRGGAGGSSGIGASGIGSSGAGSSGAGSSGAGSGGSALGDRDAGVDSGGAGDGGTFEDIADAGLDAAVDNSCLDAIDDYTQAGPFAFDTALVDAVRMWLPKVPSGCHVPIVSFANGTGAQCSTYNDAFEHLASHGFLVACYETGNTGDGTPCVEAIATALEAYPELADRRIGIGGHVQGGGSAAVCVQRAEERWGASARFAGLGAQPEHGFGGMGEDFQERYAQIRSPMFVFHGSEAGQGGAQWVGDGFALLDPSTEAYWYVALGAPYIPIPIAWINEAAVAWFRWQLLDDEAACRYFLDAMPASDAWDLEDAHSQRDCEP